ncbi:MAG: alpha/beta fold hydrolase [Actinomycetota bacterium]|nr:alpha/beta fold hydrolase [Actinomycetota bacterium]
MPLMPGAEPFALDGAPGGTVGVVLCHGFTGTPSSLRPWGEHLAAAGITVRCPRLPGHGTRWQDMNATRWPDWYAELERTFDELLADLPTVFAMGLSMGGTLCLRLGEQRAADVAGLVLVNPSLATERKDAKLLSLMSRVVPSIPGVGSDIKKPGVTELAYDRTPLKAAYSLSQLWAQTRADLDKLTAPILTFRSRTDHVVEPVSGRLLLDGASSTRVREVVLEDSFHVATLDNDAPAIFADSVEFVRANAPVS